MARTPLPGGSKTRLCPPCTLEQAAALAEAALGDTLEAVVATRAARRVLALEGLPGGWIPDGFDVIPQRGEGLGERLAAAFADTGAPALAIGMDTPQVTPGILNGALDTLSSSGIDSVVGPAEDGGYWAIGLREADSRIFDGVPMSTAATCEAQIKRLNRLGLTTSMLPHLRDVDYFEDARAVSARCAGSRFEQAFQQVLATGLSLRHHI
jgi:rSAM/selenodomain-associated transferase 1